MPEVREAGHADEGEADRVELGTGQVVLDVHPRDLERAVGIAREQRTAARGAGPGQHPRVRPAAVGGADAGGVVFPTFRVRCQYLRQPFGSFQRTEIHDARVEAMDAVRAAAPADRRTPEQRMKDPGGDAFRVEWQDEAGDHWLLAEPFTPYTASSVTGLQAELRTGEQPGGGWWAEASIPLTAGAPRQLNVGVADNDQTYHTQWRWLAPADLPAGFAAPRQP